MRYAQIDGYPQEGEPFDYDAEPTRFFYDVETVGGLEPDQIVQQGIKVLQQKLAGIIQGLQGGEDHPMDGFQSPQMNGTNYGGPDPGFTTPGPYGGGASAWGGGATTPYGATPYGGTAPNPW